jgi:hypothetical protein
MNLARSTFYDKPAAQSFGDAKIVEKIGEICADHTMAIGGSLPSCIAKALR